MTPGTIARVSPSRAIAVGGAKRKFLAPAKKGSPSCRLVFGGGAPPQSKARGCPRRKPLEFFRRKNVRQSKAPWAALAAKKRLPAPRLAPMARFC